MISNQAINSVIKANYLFLVVLRVSDRCDLKKRFCVQINHMDSFA